MKTLLELKENQAVINELGNKMVYTLMESCFKDNGLSQTLNLEVGNNISIIGYFHSNNDKEESCYSVPDGVSVFLNMVNVLTVLPHNVDEDLISIDNIGTTIVEYNDWLLQMSDIVLSDDEQQLILRFISGLGTRIYSLM